MSDTPPRLRVSLERTDWGSYVLWHVDCEGRRDVPPMRYAVRDDKEHRTLLECKACHRKAWLQHGSALGEHCLDEQLDTQQEPTP